MDLEAIETHLSREAQDQATLLAEVHQDLNLEGIQGIILFWQVPNLIHLEVVQEVKHLEEVLEIIHSAEVELEVLQEIILSPRVVVLVHHKGITPFQVLQLNLFLVLERLWQIFREEIIHLVLCQEEEPLQQHPLLFSQAEVIIMREIL